jgi:hypothetical protein
MEVNMASFESVRLKNGAIVPYTVSCLRLSAVLHIKEYDPALLMRLVRGAGDPDRLDEGDRERLAELDLLEQDGSLETGFVDVLLSAVTIGSEGPIVSDPIRR